MEALKIVLLIICGIIAFYIAIRIGSSAVFRSYFEQKRKLNNVDSDNESQAKKGGK